MNPLFALSVLPEHVLIALLGIGLAALVTRDVVRALFKVDDKLEDIHRMFIELTKLLTAHNMPHLAEVTEALGVGDISDAVGHIKMLIAKLKDPKMAAAMLDAMFLGELPARLKTDTGRLEVLKIVGDWAIANPEAVKAAGLVIALLPK